MNSISVKEKIIGKYILKSFSSETTTKIYTVFGLQMETDWKSH